MPLSPLSSPIVPHQDIPPAGPEPPRADNDDGAPPPGPNQLDIFRGDPGTGNSGSSGGEQGIEPGGGGGERTIEPGSNQGVRRDRSQFEADNAQVPFENMGFIPGLWSEAQADYSELAMRLAQRRRLNPDAEQDLLHFAKQPAGAQRVITHCALLEIGEMLQQQARTAEYKLSDDLKTNINKYVVAFLLSPKASAYIVGSTECVLAAMRQLGLDLPLEHEQGRLEVVKSRISTVLTDRRHKMKQIIAKSLPPTLTVTIPAPAPNGSGVRGASTTAPTAPGPSEASPVAAAQAVTPATGTFKNVDIATLCGQLVVAKFKTRVTLDMYHRVAFLRYCLAKNGNTDKFWNQVDTRLEQVRLKFPIVAGGRPGFDEYFKKLYTIDIDKYGAAARGGFVPAHQVESWQATVETQSAKAAAYKSTTS